MDREIGLGALPATGPIAARVADTVDTALGPWADTTAIDECRTGRVAAPFDLRKKSALTGGFLEP